MTAAGARIASRIKHKDASVRTRMLDIAAGLDDVIALGRGDPDLATPVHIVEAGRKALAEGATHYTHPMGLPVLRDAICRTFARDDRLDYAPDEVVVTAGAQEAVFAAMLALVEPGDEVLVQAPGYTSYDQAIELAGGRVVPVLTEERDDYALTAAAVRARLSPKTRVLCLINPCNPTGAVTPPGEVEALAALAVEHDLVVISDEIYARLVYDGAEVLPVARLPGMKARTITINGFSKTYAMTGWRIGYFGAPKPWVTAMAEVHHGLTICAPAVSQHAALAALTGPQDCVEEMRRTYDERRQVMCAALDAMGLGYGRPAGAFYVYANVSTTGLPASEFCPRLLQDARVMMFPGTLFGDPNDDHVRISLLQPRARIEEACARMAGTVRRLTA
jgi:aminotransferase